jgi:hypothetical protein
MLGNSFLLSAVYLALGLGVELLRRVHPSQTAMRASVALDRLPAGVLSALGVLDALRDAYLANQLSAFQLRLVFGLTTVALIFALAFVVGLVMWAGLLLRARRSSRSSAQTK